jgi:asparagine synthase (glutamine-hydrolysing)
MCGISGVLSADGADLGATVDAQLAAQHHRGPDAAGRFSAASAVIAQNRLAIIDLQTGDPPITDESGTTGAVLNGEIYNFVELRGQLEKTGHRFSTAGDTEVLAHLAQEHEPADAASLLDGMFAFAIWDGRRERLILGRDRLGKKPLHYWADDDSFVFASEIKGVLAHRGVPCELNPRAVSAYLTFGYVPTPETFYAGIRSVPPGHVLVVEPGERPQLIRYWRPPLVNGEDGRGPRRSLTSAAADVRRLLTDAVRRRLVSDVPLGAFLSGGIDSSTVVAIMAELTDRPVQTFTIGFEDRDGYDERPFARLVAERFKTEHHEFVVKPDAIDLVERLVWHHDQPFGDSSAIPTYLVSELTRRHVTVALCGDGGDELFSGYERFAAALLVDRYLSLPAVARRGGRALLDRLPQHLARGRIGNAQRFAAVAELGMPEAYLSWLSFVDDTTRRALLDGAASSWAQDAFCEHWRATAGAHPLDRVLDLNLQTYLLDDLLVKVDRMSMAHGLEVRSPMLDRALVEFTIRLAPNLKLRGPILKRVLKRAMRDQLPREVLVRRKRGFGVPLDRWFRDDLAGYTAQMLGEGARVRGHLRPRTLDQLLAEHASCRRNHGHALWTLLTLEVFLRMRGW